MTDAQIHTPVYDGPLRCWKRSAKGNLWRRWGRFVLTVFLKGSGRFAWVINADDADPRFSPLSYDSEEEAVAAVWYEVDVEVSRCE